MSTASLAVPASRLSTALAPPGSQQSRQSERQRLAPRSRRPGSTGRSFNAGTASRARSCPRRRSLRATHIRRMAISTTQCPATSAAVGPMSAFARRSSKPRNRREANNGPRSHHFPSRRHRLVAINEQLCANRLRGVQPTGNSNATRGAWRPLRQAGAVARTMLVSAAAKRWNVDPTSCRPQSGEVFHAPTGRRIKYGELAADAARLPVPENVALKQPKDFKVIGTPAKRLDSPAKDNGTAVYGIDVRPPGVKVDAIDGRSEIGRAHV